MIYFDVLRIIVVFIHFN